MSQNHIQRRKEALERYLKGEKIKDICRAMTCSKSFLYRWLARFNAAHPRTGWEQKEQSGRPLTSPFKTSEAIRQEIVRLKKAWSRNEQRSCAVPFIQQALKQQGLLPAPSRRTIYRILSRHEKEVNESMS